MAEPFDKMLDAIEWKPVDASHHDPESTLPFATHSGVLEFCGGRLRAYQLSTGERVFDADDVQAFLEGNVSGNSSNSGD